MNFRNLRKSYQAVFRFFLKKKKHKLIFFKVPSEVLFPSADHNIVKRVSHKIDDGLANNNPEAVRRLIKLGWLISELKFNGVKNPMQLICSGPSKYFCHPGTDRLLITCYIDPQPYIEGFYIWYPDIDPNPFILDYEHYEIKNPFTFISKFIFSDTLRIDEVQLTPELNVSDEIYAKSH